MSFQTNSDSELYTLFKGKMLNTGLISEKDEVSFNRIHPIRQNDEIIFHYIATIAGTKKKYLIRTIKEKDYSCSVSKYLININNTLIDDVFPSAISDPFEINHHTYIITTFFDGDDLGVQLSLLTNDELLEISDKLNDILKILHSTTINNYSILNSFESNSFAEIFFNNIKLQCDSKYNIFIDQTKKEKFLVSVYDILSKSTFSPPTLVHMDIKPANIIFLRNEKRVCLIDFELARFSDLDYEWSNILIKTLHVNDIRFKNYVLNPIIDKNFMKIDRAIQNDKIKVYLLYLSINKYIYNASHQRENPRTISDLAFALINQFY